MKILVELETEDPFVYFCLARIYRQLGDLDKAITNCMKALEIRPGIGDVSQLLERLLQEQEEKNRPNGDLIIIMELANSILT